MDADMKVGTVVILKSGGPLMCVSSLENADGLICCEWFTIDGEFHRDAFDKENLVIVNAIP